MCAMGAPSTSSDASAAGSNKLCQECEQNEFKYKCPGCGVRSCGLGCVKAHKERTGCTGKRDRTVFVPLAEFCDNVLVSDYNLLEEMLRQTESAKRLRAPLGGLKFEMHPAMKSLQHQAKMRETALLFLSHGMSKRKSNSSFFDRKRKCIFWRIEWVFEGTEVRIVNARVDENSTLKSVLEKHFVVRPDNTAVITQLRHFYREPINELKLYFQKEPSKATSKEFYELDVEDTVRSQLAHKTVYEYPVIHVAISANPNRFPVAICEKPVISVETDAAMPDAEPEVQGISFQEEEIEEGEFIP